jgi:multisubunit Na+/H+ antiporter MnhG subunit
MSAQEHGHTVANWTGVTISFVGFVIAAVGMVGTYWAILIVGLVIALAGAIIGKMLASAGKGQVYNRKGAADPRVEAINAATAAAAKRRAASTAAAVSGTAHH